MINIHTLILMKDDDTIILRIYNNPLMGFISKQKTYQLPQRS